MYEIIFHGRGGQGALLAARLLANVFFHEGKHVEAFPHFGGERRGAPVEAFLRVDDKPIRAKTPIISADCAIILDASLLEALEIELDNLKGGGLIILNSNLKPEEIKLKGQFNLATCDATGISLRILKKDIPNSAILGALAFALNLSLDSLIKGFKEIFIDEIIADKNIEMARMGFNYTTVGKSSRETVARKVDSQVYHDVELATGGTYRADGSSRKNITSTWTTQRAEIDNDKCHLCMLCYVLCPEVCIQRDEKGLTVEGDYCKGCGICEKVCPVGAIKLYEKTVNRT